MLITLNDVPLSTFLSQRICYYHGQVRLVLNVATARVPMLQQTPGSGPAADRGPSNIKALKFFWHFNKSNGQKDGPF